MYSIRFLFSLTIALALGSPSYAAASAEPVAALAYHPSGRILAAGGRGHVHFFDADSGEWRATWEGQRPRITALAFRPDGKQLAIAGGTIGAAHEVRLYAFDAANFSMAEQPSVVNAHSDVIHGLAYSPDGKLLASCGYDRLIKLWDMASPAKKELHVLKDHSDAVYAVAFRPDGKMLASAAADRTVKLWDVATGARLHTLSEATDWLYALAWSPDGTRLAAGGVDKSIRVWRIDESGGKIAHSAFAHEKPVLRLAYAADGSTLFSLGEDRIVKAWDAGRVSERKVFARQPETVLSMAVRPDGKQLALGRYDGVLTLLDTASGKTLAEPLPLKSKPHVNETEPNDSPRTGQRLMLPATVRGSLGRAGDVDYYRFEAKAGQEIGVRVQPLAGAKLETILHLIDADGHVLTESTNGLLGHAVATAGFYALGIRDRDYRGDPKMKYELMVGDVPLVTGIFPLGLQRGTEAEIRLQGVHLGAERTVRVKAAADAALGSRLPVAVAPGVLGNPSVRVEEYPQIAYTSEGNVLPIPSTGNGRIDKMGALQTWRFTAKKGERLLLEVNAARSGSPLDSTIEILDDQGRLLPRATLRCLARTYSTFRDHDSATLGIRIEAWSDLAMDDYILLGGELMRIRALPKNPDDDCQFWSLNGKRRGYLGTTPTFHAQGQPMYKVALHPPGATFPTNGLPLVTLPYRNDDGGGGFGKDSRLVFDPPADGVYQIRIADARGQGGSRFAYQLTIRPPRPDFSVRFSPTAPTVSKGGAVSLEISAERRDEFDGAIEVRLENLPPGFHAPTTTIPAHENSTNLALFAATSATVSEKATPLKLIARAVVEGEEVMREAKGGVPKLIKMGDIMTTTEQSELTLQPGGEVRLTVNVERRNGFQGRIPVEVKGLPHGVQVLDIGLNGILITERETTRTFVIHAEPWVAAMKHPFVVLARNEKKNSEHAAKSVLLHVVK